MKYFSFCSALGGEVESYQVSFYRNGIDESNIFWIFSFTLSFYGKIAIWYMEFITVIINLVFIVR